MSTAGKVLVVLNVLMLLIGVVLVSGVTQLNTNGAQKLEQLTKDVETAQADLAKTEKDVRELTAKVTLEQVEKEEDLRVLRSNLSNGERAVSVTLETLTRLQVQVEEFEKTLKHSEETKTQRQEEKTALEGLRATEEALVKTLQQQNGELITQLQGLREKFKQVTQENREFVAKILKGGNTRPTASPSS